MIQVMAGTVLKDIAEVLAERLDIVSMVRYSFDTNAGGVDLAIR